MNPPAIPGYRYTNNWAAELLLNLSQVYIMAGTQRFLSIMWARLGQTTPQMCHLDNFASFSYFFSKLGKKPWVVDQFILSMRMTKKGKWWRHNGWRHKRINWKFQIWNKKLCHLKELGKGSKMLKTAPRYDKRILSYGNLKTFKVSPSPGTMLFVSKQPCRFFYTVFFHAS